MKNKLLLLLALTFGLASNIWADIPIKNNVYQIGTAAHLVEFATVVSSTANAKAVLTADITLTNPWTTPIGTSSKSYTGTFDGQGHKITGFNATSSGKGGLFGNISKATIKNFSIAGNLTANSGTGSGVIGWASGSTISNIHSTLTISVPNGDTHHVGGVVGSAQGSNTISGCSFAGSMSITGGSTDNFAGVVAYIKGGDNITNCANDGEISFTNTSCGAGGVVGYNNSTASIKNCLNTGSIICSGGSPTHGGAIVGRQNSSINAEKISNNYWLGTSATKSSGGNNTLSSPSAESVSSELLASGGICFALNESKQGGVWRQNLAEDAYPTLDTSHEKVFEWDGVLYNTEDVPDLTISDEDDLKKFADIVNGGATSVNAELADDIDMTSIAAKWVPIGDWNTNNVNSAYKGHFNGQGHEISNFIVTTSQTYYGFFGVVSAATIENFSIEGSITNTDDGKSTNIGVIGYSRDAIVNIRDIQSYLTITNSANNKYVGGILGSGNAGTTNIDRCAFFGIINANDKTSAGGIVGYFANGNTAIVNITNCLFAGTISGENSDSNCGGIAGYGGENVNNVKIKNCLSLGTITATTTKKGQFFGNILNTGSSITKSYYQGDNINGTGSSTLATLGATAVTNEQLASGEVCYALNGNQSDIAWYQTLPASPDGDATPTLDSTHGQVYVNGTVCPNTNFLQPQGDTPASYSNTDGSTVGEHNYVEGFCSYCDYFNPTAFSPVDGYYQIANSAQLKWLAAYVNQIDASVNAKLTATPIDMTGVEWTPIGNSSNMYTGTFDGQHNAITNFSYTSTGYGGLFGEISNATVKDFCIDGTLTVTSGTYSGVIGSSRASTVSGIHSTLTINVTGTSIGHVGGIVGTTEKANNNTISGCSYAGTMTVADGNHNCFGGVAGYLGVDNVLDCANYGNINYAKSTCYVGGIVGYLNTTSATIQNCLNTGSITYTGEGETTYGGGAIIGYFKKTSASNVRNNYWLETSATCGSGTNALGTIYSADADQLASGEVAYKLGAAWYQTIGTDDEPTLDSSHKQVILNGSYENVAATLSLNDAKSFGTNSNFDVTSVSMTRTLKADKWNTFCIPFDMTSSEITSQLGTGTEVMALTGVTANGENYTMTFGTASSIEAGKPYMVKVKNAVSSFSLGDKTIKGTITPVTVKDASNNSLTFTGVFNNGYAPLNSFIISNNAFYLVDTAETVNLKAFRGYITTSSGSSVKAMNYVFEDTEDGISSLTPDPSPVGEGSIYNLAGQRISKMQKGINIVNGKKIMK